MGVSKWPDSHREQSGLAGQGAQAALVLVSFPTKEHKDMASISTVQTRALQVMQPNCHPALRLLRVQETDEAIIISGRVSSYYLKQLAQETLMAVRGTRELTNRVTVVRD
jgi:hypothetical protein